MEKEKITRLTLDMHSKKTSVELPFEDADLDDLFECFKVVLIGATFEGWQIDDYIIRIGEELAYDKKHKDD